MRVCRSPRLIVASHGLRRLRLPRHPPHAFVRLTTSQSVKQSTRDPSRVISLLLAAITVLIRDRHALDASVIPRSTPPSVVKQPMRTATHPRGASAGIAETIDIEIRRARRATSIEDFRAGLPRESAVLVAPDRR